MARIHQHSYTTDPAKRLRWAICLLALVVLLGTIGFVILERLSVFEALYMTLTTISTLGLREMGRGPNGHLSTAGNIWVMILVVGGIAAATYALSLLVSVLVEGQLRQILGRRKLTNKIAALRNHFIICGYGHMGQLIAKALQQRGHQVVIVDNQTTRTELAETAELLYIRGNAMEESVLLQAGIEHAKALVATLGSDADNVFVTLTARGLRPDLTIVARCDEPASEDKLLRAGATRVVSPQTIGAQRMANILTRPAVVEFVDLAVEGVELEVDQVHLASGSKLIGKTLRESQLRQKAGVMVAAIKPADSQLILSPEPDYRFKQGDTLIIVGQSQNAARLHELCA